jgi:aspartate/methionine/tyrosine aminotransferase
MPRYPAYSSSVADLSGSVFSALSHRLASHDGEVYPLHVGDTWLEPAPGCRMEDLDTGTYPWLNRYAPPQGIPELIDAIVERSSLRTGVETQRENVLVAAGATGALGAVVGATLDPGDDVLILAPYWPLISGIVRSFHANPIPVPFLGEVDSPETAIEAVESQLTAKTAALYLSSPNNPTGQILPAQWIEGLVDWCARNGLWIYSDEVYEDLVYEGNHTYCRSLDPARTFSVHSFSKAFGMAGNRCGYVVGPAESIEQLRKVSVHTFYSAPTASQVVALRALQGAADQWLSDARELYLQLGVSAAQRLGVAAPQGSTFLFLDVEDRLDARGLLGFLEDCVDRGLFVAPGPSFGPYPHHIRVCYTSAEPAVVRRGIEVLADLTGR